MKIRSRYKIVITGPEATGKTTLSAQLAAHFDEPLVPEYAREYLSALDRPYTPADIPAMGRRQRARQDEALQRADTYLFCDTGPLVLKVWLDFKYGLQDDWVENQFLHDPVDLYLLCRPDIPWTPDPLREHPTHREELFLLYRQALEQANKNFVIISGTAEHTRKQKAIRALERLVG